VRAVGAASGKNPIAIVAPCHRVIGASGRLTGFAGGLEAKASLLRVEGRRYGANPTAASRELEAAGRRGKPSRAEAPSLFDGR
jgi:methylated-DNA-[protein]-cysteine S-methyltransferase